MTRALTVSERRCDQCLFTKDRIVSGERAAEVIKGCREDDTYFVCHKGSLVGDDHLVCHGFYTRFKHDITVFRLAQSLGIVKMVPIPTGD